MTIDELLLDLVERTKEKSRRELMAALLRVRARFMRRETVCQECEQTGRNIDTIEHDPACPVAAFDPALDALGYRGFGGPRPGEDRREDDLDGERSDDPLRELAARLIDTRERYLHRASPVEVSCVACEQTGPKADAIGHEPGCPAGVYGALLYALHGLRPDDREGSG